jgi:hypothetical protein
MAQVITITIPKKLERRLAGTPNAELEKRILDFLNHQAFEKELADSKELQKGILKLLASKSRLTKASASKIAKKIGLSMADEAKSSDLL